MLDTMRRHSGSMVMYLILGAIIVVFAVSFNPGSGSCVGGPTSYAALVDGESIPQQTYALNLGRQLEMYRRNAQASGIPFDSDMIERMGLKKQVIDGLINRKLLAQEARRRGLVVTDEELLTYIQDRFGVRDISSEQYGDWIWRNFQVSVSRFELDVREQILGEKLERFLGDTVALSDAELWADYLREHDRVMVTFVKFDPSAVTLTPPKESEVAALLASELASVEKAYHDDIVKYRTPLMVRARHILRKLDPGATDAELAKARGLLLELKTQIAGGADFATLAREHSQDDATAKAGGDLGPIARGERLKAIEEAVFALKKDELSAEPVRSPLGLHLFQVTEIVPPGKKPFEAVKAQIAADLLRDRRGGEAARGKAEEFLRGLRAGKTIESLTVDEAAGRDKVVKPVRYESGWILSDQKAIPRIGASEELVAEVFALTRAEPVAKQVHKVGRAYFVVTLKDKETPDKAQFESSKTSLRQSAAGEKRGRIYRDWIEHLRQKARIDYNQQLFPPPEQAT